MAIFNNKGKTCDEFCTPYFLFNKLNNIFNFTLDAACTSYNCKCKEGFFVDKNINGLLERWSGNVFCNPPFSQKSEWVEKAHNEIMANNCNIVVMILPTNSMETSCWHKFIYPNYKYDILQGRVQFIHPDPDKNVGNNSGTTIVYFFNMKTNKE